MDLLAWGEAAVGAAMAVGEAAVGATMAVGEAAVGATMAVGVAVVGGTEKAVVVGRVAVVAATSTEQIVLPAILPSIAACISGSHC